MTRMELGNITMNLKREGRKVLVPFFTAGFPDDDAFLLLVEAASRAGCPVIEIGVPFSDPIADGPVIQRSSQLALAAGMSLPRALELTGAARRAAGAHTVLMSYFNPILRMGVRRFCRTASRYGISGVVVADLPFEESSELRSALEGEAIALIDFISPTTDQERAAGIVRGADGFLYLISITGVTGTRSALDGDFASTARMVRRYTELPLYVGFGISSPADAASACMHADGAIVGSALIRAIESAGSGDEAVARIERILAEMNEALNPTDGGTDTCS